jgi:hypothetical protein
VKTPVAMGVVDVKNQKRSESRIKEQLVFISSKNIL